MVAILLHNYFEGNFYQEKSLKGNYSKTAKTAF